jgi:hypothetical protein
MGKRNYPERQEQLKFIAWLKREGIKHHASPNGERRSQATGSLLKAMGMSAGFPDVFIPIRRGHYGALFIEMKPIKGGKVQENQIEWLRYLREEGYCADIAYGFEEAKRLVSEYFRLEKHQST